MRAEELPGVAAQGSLKNYRNCLLVSTQELAEALPVAAPNLYAEELP
jgi:hypothetical protein